MQEQFVTAALAREEDFPKRVFCDFHQTLEHPGGNELVPYHIPLLQLLKRLQDSGYEIIIFSGSPSRTEGLQEMCRLEFGRPDFFGEVRHKKDYAGTGTRAEYVFDDKHGSHDIEARFKWGPMDREVFDLYDALSAPKAQMPLPVSP